MSVFRRLLRALQWPTAVLRQRRQREAAFDRRVKESMAWQRIRSFYALMSHLSPSDTGPIYFTRAQWEAAMLVLPSRGMSYDMRLAVPSGFLGHLMERPVYIVDTQDESTFPGWWPAP